MTAKKYRTLCRIKVEQYSKLANCVILVVLSLLAWFFAINGYLFTAAVIPIWLYLPDLVAYLLECRYHIKHNKTMYR